MGRKILEGGRGVQYFFFGIRIYIPYAYKAQKWTLKLMYYVGKCGVLRGTGQAMGCVRWVGRVLVRVATLT